MKNNTLLLSLVIFAVFVKIFLYIFALENIRDMKIETDSYDYLHVEQGLYQKQAFGTIDQDGKLKPEIFRTPGYPVFLCLLHDCAGISLDGIVLIQIFLSCITAWLVYRIALFVNKDIAALSALICLFDVPTTIWSQRIMTEALFTFLLVGMIGMFFVYLKEKKVKFLIFAAIFLVLATYVRPISFFLAIPLALFLLWAGRSNFSSKLLRDIFIFLTVTYLLLGIWSIRNFYVFHTPVFSSINSGVNKDAFSIFAAYTKARYPQLTRVPDFVYYLDVILRSWVTLMLNPGSWKYFHNPVLAIIGKVYAYIVMIFWLPGLLIGVFRIGRNLYFQLLMVIISYFTLVTVIHLGLCGNERFRVVITPCIAIISASGWAYLIRHFKPSLITFFKTGLTKSRERSSDCYPPLSK